MSKKVEKETWETVNKEGFFLSSFEMMDNFLIRQIIHEYDLQTAMCYLIILSHRNKQTDKCFPSINVIAKECGVSERSVKGYLKKLYEGGFLIIDSGRQGVSNEYYFPKEKFYNGSGVTATRRSKGNFQK